MTALTFVLHIGWRTVVVIVVWSIISYVFAEVRRVRSEADHRAAMAEMHAKQRRDLEALYAANDEATP